MASSRPINVDRRSRWERASFRRDSSLHRKITIAIAAAALVGTTVAIGAPAFADDSTADPAKLAQVNSTLVQPLGIHTLTLSNSGDSGAAPDGVQPLDTRFSSGTLADSKSESITPPGGSKGPLETGYDSTVSLGAVLGASISGTSYGYWLGATPTNANSLTLKDTWSAAMVGGSVSLPAGISGTISGSVATWSTTGKNVWQQNHSFSGVHWSGSMVSETEDSSVSATFGTSSYLLNN